MPRANASSLKARSLHGHFPIGAGHRSHDFCEQRAAPPPRFTPPEIRADRSCAGGIIVRRLNNGSGESAATGN
jgi:hypothetical protein